MLHPYLQHQRDTRREESHEHKVVGQDRHAAKAAHDFQLPHTWNVQTDTPEVSSVLPNQKTTIHYLCCFIFFWSKAIIC